MTISYLFGTRKRHGGRRSKALQSLGTAPPPGPHLPTLQELHAHAGEVLTRMRANCAEVARLHTILRAMLDLASSPEVEAADVTTVWPVLQAPEIETEVILEDLLMELTLLTRALWEGREG
jgi:hypothetical protein